MERELLDKVLAHAQSSASHSWEYGTVFEALFEYHNPSYSVFNDPFPNGHNPASDENDVPGLEYVKSFILTDNSQLCEGNGMFIFFRGPVTCRPNISVQFFSMGTSTRSTVNRSTRQHPTQFI
jgi:hypothetical protein